ncbi:hypothetical protein [Paenibacillus shirakamiensis]|uniref:hypothetical protein n=1 Tax=Paenibacillus shirakamiensis TaxID=1265935 RepID=UPI001AE8DD07|nr:hypothetical protein [Paenibacillus shirakamiensis]
MIFIFKVAMNKQRFQELSDEELTQALFGPMIHRYKEEQLLGHDFMDIYQQMTKGQQAFFVFQTYYIHASSSLTEFYWWSVYYVAERGRWKGLLSGLNYFGEDELVQILQQVEQILLEFGHPVTLDDFNISRDQLHQRPKLLKAIETVEEPFQIAVKNTLQRIMSYIRSHPEEFVTWEEDHTQVG